MPVSGASHELTPRKAAPPDALSILNIRNIVTVALLALIIYILWVIRGVLTLFMAAIVIAFLLYPIVRWMQDLPLGKTRKLGMVPAILIVYVAVFVLVAVLGVLLATTVQSQFALLADSLGGKSTEQLVGQLKAIVHTHFSFVAVILPLEQIDTQIDQFAAQYLQEGSLTDLVGWVREHVNASAILGGTAQAVTVLIALPIIVFYMVRDAQVIRATLLNFVPPAFLGDIQAFLANLELMLNKFLRGQIKLALWIFGLDVVLLRIVVPDLGSWFLLAVIAGITEIIPVVGPTIALIIAVVIAGVEGGVNPMIKVAIVFSVVQVIENQVLVPRIMGKQLDVHPLTVMFFLAAGGVLGGVVGALLSLPIAATLKVVVNQYYPAFIKRVEMLLVDDDQPPPPPPPVIEAPHAIVSAEN